MTARKTADAGPADADADPNERACYASPPCFMHELDPGYLGYMGTDELLALLVGLRETGRADARRAAALARRQPAGPACRLLRDLAVDEARFCAVLAGHVGRLGGHPGGAGARDGTTVAGDDLAAEIRLLDRSQGGLADRLRAVLGRVADDALHADLRAMLEARERNRARLTALPL